VTFLLGVRGVQDADFEVYSMLSRLGSAIVGARPGDQRTYSIPSGVELPVTLLKAVPYGMHTPKSRRRQSVASRRTSDPRCPSDIRDAFSVAASAAPKDHAPQRGASREGR
jgi:transcription elongation factor GreA